MRTPVAGHDRPQDHLTRVQAAILPTPMTRLPLRASPQPLPCRPRAWRCGSSAWAPPSWAPASPSAASFDQAPAAAPPPPAAARSTCAWACGRRRNVGEGSVRGGGMRREGRTATSILPAGVMELGRVCPTTGQNTPKPPRSNPRPSVLRAYRSTPTYASRRRHRVAAGDGRPRLPAHHMLPALDGLSIARGTFFRGIPRRRQRHRQAAARGAPIPHLDRSISADFEDPS